jgi:MFS family permease
VFGVAFFLLGAPLNLLFQRRPPGGSPEVLGELVVDADGEAEPADAGEPGAEPEEVKQVPVREALRYPPVWFLLSSRAVGSVANQMITVHIIAFLVLSGYGALEAALALGSAGLLGIGGRPGFGLLSDYLGRETTFTICMGMLTAALLTVLVFGGSGVWWPLFLFMVLTGLSDGLNGLLIGAKAADLYPPRVLGTVMGVVETGRGLGIALGPVLSGALFDWKQDYVLAFSVSIVLTLVGVALLGGTADAGRGPLLTGEGQQGGPSKVVGRAIKMTL